MFLWNCRTPIGRGRAWLYLAVMQKKLADYLKVLLDHKNLLRYRNICISESVLIQRWGSIESRCFILNKVGERQHPERDGLFN